MKHNGALDQYFIYKTSALLITSLKYDEKCLFGYMAAILAFYVLSIKLKLKT